MVRIDPNIGPENITDDTYDLYTVYSNQGDNVDEIEDYHPTYIVDDDSYMWDEEEELVYGDHLGSMKTMSDMVAGKFFS